MIDSDSFNFTEEIVRDGSYASDFKFDPDDLRRLLNAVDGLSFVDTIDVGPGTGLGTPDDVSKPSDEEHLRFAAETVTDTDVTTLVLPSLAGESEIDLITSYTDTLDQIRIGVDADSVSDATEFLSACDDLDIPTSLNLLKTYLISPTEAVKAAELAVEYGADMVYVVDSAGGLVPDDVAAYVSCLKESVDIEVGFHGHDNLGCGLQNTIAAAEAGATHLDASAQGIGRSAGNVQTELLCAHFDGGLPREDWHRLFELEELLEDIYPGEKGISTEDILYGLATFHSSFEPELRALAEERNGSFAEMLIFAAENGFATMEEIRQGYESLEQ
jgi:4-hydroxy-2-oxovalerate aldolase